ncbi:NYN domain-containing protein [Wenzhouxiangella sediminis]|uniref:NYN domain-containing protein n=1 Tax=Wenzhouxiangella sediminis TaxID=1792836 RepID=A0A3E1K5V3_9GAMM|nr:NYN domain-containing protein [Wenzhouxiangella sediminis]RFF29401.1 NYN domain-containing protein [Wenzhouxiangella sediminis]
MRMRRIAILIDGGYFLKRLPKLVAPQFCSTPQQIADSARYLCKRHVQRLVGLDADADEDGRWLDHVYRLFYYDATPFDGKSHHPLKNQPIDFGKSEVAKSRRELFTQLRRKRKFALRLGHVNKESNWQIDPRLTKDLIKIRKWADHIQAILDHPEAPPELPENESREFQNLIERWQALEERNVRIGLRQKGVDMRIGLDIASITLKQQADTMILVTGDSDFVPAAKLARREGIEFLLDPLWQKVSDQLYEHVDGIISIYSQPEST